MSFLQHLKKLRKKKKKKDRKRALNKCPQKKGIVRKFYVLTPKKPNSAIRVVCKLLLSNFIHIVAMIPGGGHTMMPYAHVLVKGGRIRDLPGIRYRLVRGVYELIPVPFRTDARSKYGIKKQLKGV